jgi:hypothetical protein
VCRSSGRPSNDDVRQVLEAAAVGRHHHSIGGECRCSDDQVVGAAGPTGLAYRDQQAGVGVGDVDVVAEDGKCVDEVIEERLACLPALAGCGFDADSELGDRDRGDGGLIVVGDQCIELERCPLRFDEDVGVEQEQRQNRSSTVSAARSAWTSLFQTGSTRCRRSKAFASAPVIALAGSSCAMTRPRRTIVYRSPRCSTPSSKSAKRLEASVAVTSVMAIRLSDHEGPPCGADRPSTCQWFKSCGAVAI